MSKKIITTTLATIIAMSLGTSAMADAGNPAAEKKTKEKLTKEMPKGFEKCYGIAKAGKNDCGSSTEACAGQSKVDGAKDAWIGLATGTCDRIVGGSTTEQKENS